MLSIWQKQSGGLFRSECLIFLCLITHYYSFLPVEQHFFSGVAVLIAVLGHARYRKSRAVLICSVRPVG